MANPTNDEIIVELFKACHHMTPTLMQMWRDSDFSKAAPAPEDTETKPEN